MPRTTKRNGVRGRLIRGPNHLIRVWDEAGEQDRTEFLWARIGEVVNDKGFVEGFRILTERIVEEDRRRRDLLRAEADAEAETRWEQDRLLTHG